MSSPLKPRMVMILAIALAAAFVLTGCGLSLAEDITPPPNYRSPTAFTPQPVEVSTVFPLVPPDPAQGQAIYAEKCLPCHGATGMGDGPQSANLSNPAPPIGSSDLARQRKPSQWFNIVTRGNLERLMPGFSQSLNDRQRWDVVAYVFTLSATASELEQGKVLYNENCAGCHGEGGLGDGAQAASLSTRPTSWKEQSQLSQLSANEVSEVIAQGVGEMPAYADTLDESQRQTIAAYIRSLSFSAPGQAPQASAATETSATPGTTPAVSLDKITISGKITNSSSGGALPEEMKVTLLAYKGMEPAFELTSEPDQDGVYRFEDVDYQSDYVYIARVDIDQMSYNSDILHGADVTGEQAELPVQIYDVSTDASVLKADRLHVFFDFTQPGKVQVVQLFIISNPTDLVIAATDPTTPVLTFDLPEGALNLQFEDGAIGDRYVSTATGFGDTMSVPPGEGQHQILFSYELPYDRKLDLQLTTPMSVEAAIIMVPQDNVRLQSEQLADAGERSVQGMSFQMYQATTALAPNDTLQLNLSGRPTLSGAPAEGDQDDLVPLLIGAGVFLVVLGGAAYWFLRQRNNLRQALETVPVGGGMDEEESSDALLEAILALDDLFQSGQLPEAAYQERRSALKARLAFAMEQEK